MEYHGTWTLYRFHCTLWDEATGSSAAHRQSCTQVSCLGRSDRSLMISRFGTLIAESTTSSEHKSMFHNWDSSRPRQVGCFWLTMDDPGPTVKLWFTKQVTLQASRIEVASLCNLHLSIQPDIHLVLTLFIQQLMRNGFSVKLIVCCFAQQKKHRVFSDLAIASKECCKISFLPTKRQDAIQVANHSFPKVWIKESAAGNLPEGHTGDINSTSNKWACCMAFCNQIGRSTSRF